ncbi:SDR family oxidoreductase [Solicola gregarius]|uniref:SDR family oxidoreductase n=1 Tax=Solicola gregarius TaxID=2908642 RepID=A0AA46TH78_9ACTN|nr:SDR family oxidoreductase [Solicola gregarius]UYM05266.1 SDR family oxidoreductase [Solicola gregarius]
MAYFVTGATGFIGRHLVAELVDHRDGDIHVLVREQSFERFERLRHQCGGTDRLKPVIGELCEPQLGVDDDWVATHRGDIDHVFHLAALYDMTAPAERNDELNIGGTRAALGLAEAVDAGLFHQVSSIAVAGDFRGRFDESMFAEGQGLPSAYHRTKYESERIVREEAGVPWRVYRPAIVVGSSETGAMDKVDGPYYFFPLLKRMRDSLPQWTPLVGMDLGNTNIVPVDYVARAMDHLAHKPGLDGRAFHLVNPEPQPTVDVVNTLARAAKAPRFALQVDRRVTGLVPSSLVQSALQSAPARFLLRQSVGRLGIPAEVVAHTSLPTTFEDQATEHELSGSGIACPDLETYASVLWGYWEQHLDADVLSDPRLKAALQGRCVVITGASSGIGKATALRVAALGGIPVLVARNLDKLEETRLEIEMLGGRTYVYSCDLSDMAAIDELTKRLVEEHDTIDVIVNNAGRSIRRSLHLSYDRFHDFERTMTLNYFGAIRLVMGLATKLGEDGGGHIVNISSIGVQTNPPRFSAYVASKAALDAWSRVVSSELIGDGITFTTIHMPLVKTPMIAPTKIYDAFPTITPAQAADLVLTAVRDRPHELNTPLGTAGEVGHALAPKLAFRILHQAYKVFPDSSAAKGASADDTATSEQVLLAKVLKGVHW